MAYSITGVVNGRQRTWFVDGPKALDEAIAGIRRQFPRAENVCEADPTPPPANDEGVSMVWEKPPGLVEEKK